MKNYIKPAVLSALDPVAPGGEGGVGLGDEESVVYTGDKTGMGGEPFPGESGGGTTIDGDEFP